MTEPPVSSFGNSSFSNSTFGTGSMYAPSPGALLRRARQAQGLHIAALAAALKVSQRKLELLENDQVDQLPDVAFARALAQAVCRHLKIEAPPVLALLPTTATAQPALERVTIGLNTPFRERAERHDPEWPGWLHPRVIAPVLLLGAAAAFLLAPRSWVAQFQLPATLQMPTAISGSGAPAPAAAPAPDATPASAAAPATPPPVAADAAAPMAAASTPGPVQGPAAATGATATVQVAEPAAAPPPEPAVQTPPPVAQQLPAGLLAVRAARDSWLEVTDASGEVLISRLLVSGEAVGVNGIAPLRVTVGNAAGMQMRFKGRPVELRLSPDNTARMQLK
jgi:cytoskeleton protein RodZ